MTGEGGGLGWVGLGWVGLGWVGLGWVGLGWVGLGWVGLGWVGLGWAGVGLTTAVSYKYPPAQVPVNSETVQNVLDAVRVVAARRSTPKSEITADNFGD